MPDSIIEIDGSLGEGGGQILRSSLTLSILTGKPFRITKIRANRKKPGLKAQHIVAVDASAVISRAQVRGSSLQSQVLQFVPGNINSGRYRFDIQTAGSTSLVFQTITLPLAFAKSASSVTITGGTHVPWAPCFDYINFIWLPYLERIGIYNTISLELAGFYPQGGGRVTSTIRPSSELSPLSLVKRGELVGLFGISAVANLDLNIAARQKTRALKRLREFDPQMKISTVQLPSRTKGTILFIVANFSNDGKGYAHCAFYSLGAPGKPAEQVADDAVDEFIKFYQSPGVLDKYIVDQLMLPLSFAAGVSEISTAEITSHVTTNAEVINSFGVADINITGEIGRPGLIQITPAVTRQ